MNGRPLVVVLLLAAWASVAGAADNPPPGRAKPPTAGAAGAAGAAVVEPLPIFKVEKHGGITAIPWQSPAQPSPEQRVGTVFVLVNQGIFPDIQPAIATYVTDLAEEGFATRVLLVTGSDQVGFRALLRAHYLELFDERAAGDIVNDEVLQFGSGAVLVGELPIPVVHGRGGDTGDGTPYEGNFVCELYFTDMDGTWSYFDSAGLPYYSTVDPKLIPIDSECRPWDMAHAKWPLAAKLGKGGARPELFLGRIAPHTVSQVGGVYNRAREVQLLNEYFARNHAYRLGQYPYVPQGAKGEEYARKNRLVYYDDDWNGMAYGAAQAHNSVWPGKIVVDDVGAPVGSEVNRYVNAIQITSKPDYLKRIGEQRWLWVESLMHSGPLEHQFSYGKTIQSLMSSELGKLKLPALFFNLQGCDTSDYRQTGNLGDTYLFLGESLAVLGNAAAGPHDTGVLYQALKEGWGLGQAQMFSQCLYARKEAWPLTWPFSGECNPKRYYCQTLLGDPTLRPRVFMPSAAPLKLALPQRVGLARIVPVVSLRRLQSETRQRASAELPARLLKVADPPTRGVDPLAVEPGQPVIDPEWVRSPNEALRTRAETFLRSLPSPRGRPLIRGRQP